ncbi:hypothetical protein PHMEG_00040803, partial [Phytophthora megakarya]
LENSSKLFFPDRDAHVCLFSDASASGWAVVLTQVREWSIDTPVNEQHHEMLVCRGGTFTKSQINWSVVEKEGYPIARACGDLEYLLDRENGFHIYCDHSNLIQIFAPGLEVKQHVGGKLQRWALRITGCRYTIEHIPGELNLWADIISRWGQPSVVPVTSRVARVQHVTTRSESAMSRLRPLEDDAFIWPTVVDIKVVQARYKKEMPTTAKIADGLATVDDKIWIPTTAQSLLLRLFIIAHCRVQAHRGENVMIEHLSARFSIRKLAEKVSKFVRDCLLCKHVKGGKIIQREWTVDREVLMRNERLHMDYYFSRRHVWLN